MKNLALEAFGKVLITRVRDQSIDEWEKIFDGRMKSEPAKAIRKKIKNFSDDSMEVLKEIAPQIVDTVLSTMLSAFESEDGIAISVNLKGVSVSNISEVSDGLAGELYGKRGWIAAYSKKPHEEE